MAVPTHFAKVIYALPSSGSLLSTSSGSLGAFVLPNALIPDSNPLEEFVVPVEAVEKASGLNLFSEEVKRSSQGLCRTVKCEVVVRRCKSRSSFRGKPLCMLTH